MAALLDKAAALDAAQAKALSIAWAVLWNAEGTITPAALRRAKQAALEAGRDWEGIRKQAWDLADSAPWTSYQIRRGVSDAAHAELARDLISEADCKALRAPWEQVTG